MIDKYYTRTYILYGNMFYILKINLLRVAVTKYGCVYHNDMVRIFKLQYFLFTILVLRVKKAHVMRQK